MRIDAARCARAAETTRFSIFAIRHSLKVHRRALPDRAGYTQRRVRSQSSARARARAPMIESKIDLRVLVTGKLPRERRESGEGTRGHSISRRSPSEIREIVKHLRRSGELPPCKFYDTLEAHAIVHYAASAMYRRGTP